MSKNDHSLWAPSSAYRWTKCPGSIILLKDMPEERSRASMLGTLAHKLAEWALLNDKENLPGPTIKRLAKEVEEESGAEAGSFLLSKEEIEELKTYVPLYLATVRLLLSKIQTFYPNGKIGVEERIDFDPKIYGEGVFGTADLTYVRTSDQPTERNIGMIVDLKYGTYEVSADTLQLRAYALGLMEKYDLEEVYVGIVQPRVADPTDFQKYSAQELRRFRDEVFLPAIQESRAYLETDLTLDAFKAGEWCKFCEAKGKCPKMDKFFDEIVPASKKDFPLVEKLSLARIGEILAKAKLLEKFVTAVEQEAFKRAMAGEKIPGFKLVRKRANRAWKVPEEKVVEILGEDAYIKKLVSPAQAEKIVGKKTIQGLWEKPFTGLTLAPVHDKRPEVEPEAQIENVANELIQGE